MTPCSVRRISSRKASSCVTQEETEGYIGLDLSKITEVHEVIKLMLSRVSEPGLGPWSSFSSSWPEGKHSMHTVVNDTWTTTYRR